MIPSREAKRKSRNRTYKANLRTLQVQVHKTLQLHVWLTCKVELQGQPDMEEALEYAIAYLVGSVSMDSASKKQTKV